MKILKVWFSEYPWDVRVEKIAQSLIQMDNEVILLCRNNHGQPRIDSAGNLLIRRLPYINRNKKTILNQVINAPAFFNPVWFFYIFKNAFCYKCDIIIVRDLPLTIPVIIVAKLLSKKVIFDMAECHVEIFKAFFKWYSLDSFFVKNPFLATIIEKYTIRMVDFIYVMSEESKKRLIQLNAKSESVSVVTNTTRLFPEKYSLVYEKKSHLKIIYIGWVNIWRGLNTVVDAIFKLKNEKNQIVFFDVLGDGDSSLEFTKEKVIKLGLCNQINFLGWVDNSQIDSFMVQSDIGILPLYKKPHYDVTISNKLFDYMAIGLPVICSNITAMARIVLQTQCGLIFDSLNVSELCTVIETMHDPLCRSKFGQNGKQAINDFYNWPNECEKIKNSLNMVKSV
jgi:glycosyltransferase involved in cell wall biosynthesis